MVIAVTKLAFTLYVAAPLAHDSNLQRRFFAFEDKSSKTELPEQGSRAYGANSYDAL